MIHTKSYDLAEIPTIPVIVQCVMSCPWCHFSHARCQSISRRPSGLHFFSTRPPGPSCITQIEIPSAPLPVTVDMPARNSNVNSRCWTDLHLLREVGHATAKNFRPLTANVVRDENPGEYDPHQRREDNIIHTTIPKTRDLVVEYFFIKKNLLFTFRKITSTIPSYKNMSRTYYHTHARDSVPGCTTCLSPDDGIVLGLTGIDLPANFSLGFRKQKTGKTCLWLIDVVRDEFLICRLFHEGPPTWQQLNIF